MSSAKQKPQRIVPPLTVDPNQRYNIGEAAAILRICRARLYQLVGDGSVQSFKEGKRRFFSGAELIRAGKPS